MKKIVRISLSIKLFLDFMHTDMQWIGDRMSSKVSQDIFGLLILNAAYR